jgi:hypothetical protein
MKLGGGLFLYRRQSGQNPALSLLPTPWEAENGVMSGLPITRSLTVFAISWLTLSATRIAWL